VIHVRDYHKTYGETVAVAGLSFDVAAGEILGLVGPNGAGKTTTLRAIAYLVGGGSWIAALSVSWLVLAIGCAPLVPCVAAAYRKFDVSVDTPP